MARGWKIAILLIPLFALLAVCALWNRLVLRHYTVRTNKLPSGASLRVLLLTDLHSCVYGKNHADLMALVTRQSPDVILLGGDIVDDNNPLENARSFFEALVGAKIPAYYVSGNHDRWRPDFESVLEMIRGYGVNVLEGKSVVVDLPGGGKINLCGLREYATAEACASSLEESFSGLSQETYNLLLAHRPDYIDLYRKYPFDLVLSGHAHGGQVRIPFLINGLYAPNQGWFPKYAGGRYDVEGTQLIVSRGLSYFPLLPRVFNPPEVVVIDVEGCA